ncbi:MAG TPA: glycosyltransferase [Solirubrobacterales bacterium]|nr:glycosyltransferase [Solirubrobacterales bacterium]
MGVYARALAEALGENYELQLHDEWRGPAPPEVVADLAICHGWRQDRYAAFDSAAFARGVTRDRAGNVLVVPFDTTLLHPAQIDQLDELFGTFWVDSELSARRIRAAGLHRAHVEVIPPPLVLPPTGEQPDRRKAGSDYAFLHVATGSPRVKGTDILLRAYAKVRDRYPAASLTILTGSKAPEAATIREMIARHVSPPHRPSIALAADSVEHAAMQRLYRESDCCVLCSRSETFGLPALEAAAAGIPVIMHRHVGAAEHREHFLHVLSSGEMRTMPAGVWRNNRPSRWFEASVAEMSELMMSCLRSRPGAPRAQGADLVRRYGPGAFGEALEGLVEGCLERRKVVC